jgi:hypothetical protein
VTWKRLAKDHDENGKADVSDWWYDGTNCCYLPELTVSHIEVTSSVVKNCVC